MQIGDRCEAPAPDGASSSLSCGPGTHDDRGVCTADVIPYQIRIAEDPVGADGRTKRRVLVIGTQPDGTPATDDVVVGMDRAGGTFTATALHLGPLGATTYLIPCDSGQSGCVGPLTLTVALASSPQTTVASTSVQLVAPTEVGTIEPCSHDANVFHIDGNDFIRNGMLTVDEGTWNVQAYDPYVYIGLTPNSPLQGNGWRSDFSTERLGTSLMPGIYENAQTMSGQVAGRPGMSINGNGHGCNTITGRYQVHSYDRIPGSTMVNDLMISFEQHCDGSTTTLLSGCVHVSK